MILNQTQIKWRDDMTPDNSFWPDVQKGAFQRDALLVYSCFDAAFTGIQTDFVRKVVTLLVSRSRGSGITLNPLQNDRDLTVVMVHRPWMATGTVARASGVTLNELLDLHEECLLYVCGQRGWATEPIHQAAEHVRNNGWSVQADLPDKRNRSRDKIARCWGTLDESGSRVHLQVVSPTGEVLAQKSRRMLGDWHDLRCSLGKLVWADDGALQLEPRTRAGLAAGPRMRIAPVL